MKVKICGLTNLEDAQTAVAAGADYLGFIFYPPSKRSVDINAAKAIVQTLRAAPTCPVLVGVFVNETGPRMAQILDEVGLDLAQLSGEEVPFLVGDEQSPIYGRSYKALRPSSLGEAEADAEWYAVNGNQTSVNSEQFPSLLIDTYHPTLRGGTGETGDWAMSAQLAESIPGLMLAGGLTAENVAEAVRVVRPFAVDVASGVEAAPGKKDPDLVRAFVHNARQAG
ncbi:MAG: phosphoribosylanthranilate isomerase [Anaerolineales bacterium]|nr:phosphoribosylanthranilate isomerase [Anaerolineales bacterium]